VSRWEIFPRQPWPRHFGHREWNHDRPYVDPDQRELALEPVHADDAGGRQPPAHEQLATVLARSRFSQREFAMWILGASEPTLLRYLRGERIPHGRRSFLQRLESVALHGDRVIITVRAGRIRLVPPRRRRHACTV